jgi:hypothetical protein
MSDQPGSFPGCAQERTKVYKKDYGWSVGLVYDPMRLPGVTTVRPGVAGVLHPPSCGPPPPPSCRPPPSSNPSPPFF